MPAEVFSSAPKINGIVDEGTTTGNSSYDHILFYENSDWMLEPTSTKVVVDFNRNSQSERAIQIGSFRPLSDSSHVQLAGSSMN